MWKKIKITDVTKSLAGLSSPSSKDYYGSSNKVIKDIIQVIVEPLTFLFSEMLVQGIHPLALKVTKVNPVFKKGE